MSSSPCASASPAAPASSRGAPSSRTASPSSASSAAASSRPAPSSRAASRASSRAASPSLSCNSPDADADVVSDDAPSKAASSRPAPSCRAASRASSKGASPSPSCNSQDADADVVSDADDADRVAEVAEADGSNSGSDSGSEEDGGSSSEAAVVATAKAAPSRIVEKFELVSITLEEHVASHDYPKHVSTCGACKFWKNKMQISASLSATNPVTLKAEPWIGCVNGQFAICLFCSAFKGPRCLSRLGKGWGSFDRVQNLVRHTQSEEHQAAEAAWKQRVRAEGAHQGNPVQVYPAGATTAATAAAQAPVVARTADQRLGGRAVVATRALLETSSSFRSLDVWRDALLGDDRAALESQQQCRKVVTTMAQYEKLVTQRILKEGVVFRLAADGLDRTYQVEIGTVLWSIPKTLGFLPSYGLKAGWLEELGPKGPGSWNG